MSTLPDLALPATAPLVEKFLHQPMKLHPAALYTLAELPESSLQELQQVCESKSMAWQAGKNVAFAPQAKFVNKPLKAVFEYHLELAEKDTFDPIRFIVAIVEDWKQNGVLLVTLNNDDMDCKVDKFCIKAEESGLMVVNLQIGKLMWMEVKGAEIPLPGRDGNEDDSRNENIEKEDNLEE